MKRAVNAVYTATLTLGAGQYDGKNINGAYNQFNNTLDETKIKWLGPTYTSTTSSLHPPTLWQVTMGTTIAASAPGVFLFSIASGLQKRMKTRIKAIPLIDRLKAGLEGLPQFLSSGLHGLASLPTCTQG